MNKRIQGRLLPTYKLGNYLKDYAKYSLDNLTNSVGYDMYQDDDYDTKLFRTAQKISNPISKFALQAGATAVGGPVAGAAVGGLQQGVGAATYEPEESTMPKFKKAVSSQVTQQYAPTFNKGGEIPFHSGKSLGCAKCMKKGGNLGEPPLDVPGTTYLPLDYDRPFYTDKQGDKRSEYKIGVESDGINYNIPTVWDGKQHSEDEAWERFKKTGEHMGAFKTQAGAERGSKLRTFMYNNVPRMQNGGQLRVQQYQDTSGYTDNIPVDTVGTPVAKSGGRAVAYVNHGEYGVTLPDGSTFIIPNINLKVK